jgi:hypothetical protein
MKNDNLVICDICGSDACYTYEVNENIRAWTCLGCGFQTNSLMKEGEEFLEENLKTLPELHKDLAEEDKEGKVWIPQTINIPDKGMIFAEGKSIKDWKWSAVKVKKFSMENKEEFKVIGQEDKYHPYKTDMSTKIEFEPGDFIGALLDIGILPDMEA